RPPAHCARPSRCATVFFPRPIDCGGCRPAALAQRKEDDMPTTRIGFGSALALFLALGGASATAAQTEPAITVERQLDATTLTRLRALAPDQEARITLHRDDSASASGDWNLRRLEVYAPDAQLWVATARGLEPMPR